jgi:hypothetical protein
MNNLNNAKIFDLIASNNFFEIIEEISQHGTVIKAALSAIRTITQNFFYSNQTVETRFDEIIELNNLSCLVPNTLVPVRVSGDGNCLYRAFSVLLFGDEQYHHTLRFLVVSVLIENKKYFESLLGIKDELNTFVQPFRKLVVDVSSDANYGAELEQLAFSIICERPLICYSLAHPLEFYAHPEVKNKTPMYLAFKCDHFMLFLIRSGSKYFDLKRNDNAYFRYKMN